MTDTPHSVADIAIFDTQTLKHPYHAYQRLRDDDPCTSCRASAFTW